MQLKVKDLAREPIELEPHETVYDARNIMVKYNISRVVIADKHNNNKAVGIITEKDIARFLYQEVPNRYLNEIRLDEVMNKNLITVTEDQDVRSCAKLMLQNNISSIIVVNEKNDDDDGYYLKGIFTKSDLVEAYARQYIGKNSVAEYMAKRVFTVAPDDTIHMALMLMINNKISRVVVVTRNNNNKPVGIISGHDLLPVSALFGTGANKSYWTIQEKSIGKRKKENMFIPAGIKEMFLVRDVMTYDPIVITKDSDLAEAAHIMMRHNISGIPVIDSRAGLAGIITRTDIIRALAGSYNTLIKGKT